MEGLYQLFVDSKKQGLDNEVLRVIIDPINSKNYLRYTMKELINKVSNLSSFLLNHGVSGLREEKKGKDLFLYSNTFDSLTVLILLSFHFWINSTF